MATSDDYFGWDLLYRTVCSKVQENSDIIVALTHWFLIKNAGFRCIGLGDDKTLHPDDIGSELLPDGWSDGHDSYALRYRHENDVYILLAAKTEDALVLNLLDSKSRNVSNLSINPNAIVKTKIGPLPEMIPTINTVLDRMKKELVDPVFIGNKKEIETQTEKRPHSRTPPIADQRFLPNRPDPLAIPRSISEDNNTRRDPLRVDPLRNIGRGDLDPLGRGGGGMIFTPPEMPFGPPGGGFNPALRPPPGARFDPFGPPDPDRSNLSRNPNPNPNVFRPPPDFDDMYM